MTDAFSWMEYPHWLIFGGVALLMVGLSGLALRRKAAEVTPVEITNHQVSNELEDDVDQVVVYNRTAKEKRKARFTENQSEDGSVDDRQNLAPSS
jgi:hypothetical protein